MIMLLSINFNCMQYDKSFIILIHYEYHVKLLSRVHFLCLSQFLAKSYTFIDLAKTYNHMSMA